MNNACPNCGALYNISSKDIGRRIACKKCRTPLTVDDAGIRLVEPSTSDVADDSVEEFEESTEGRGSRRPQRKSNGRRLTLPAWLSFSVVPTLLFGFGIFLVVVFSFFPVIDQAAVTRIQGKIDEGNAIDARDELRTNQLNNGNPSADDLEARNKRRSEWQKQQALLDSDKQIALAEASRALVWDKRGLLFGFIVLCFAGIGYLVTDQPPSRKILGAVLLVLIFLSVTNGGLMVSVGPIGP